METAKNENSESKPVNGVEKETPSSRPKSQVSNSVSFQSSTMSKEIKKSNITQIKSMKSPPQLVKDIMDAVVVLLKEQEPDWQKAVQMLNEPSLMKTISSFDQKNVKPETLEKLKHYVESPDFTHERILLVSSACAPFLDWVLDIYKNTSDTPIVHREREPKNAELEPKSPKASTPKSPRASSGNPRVASGNLRKSTTPRQSVSVCDDCAQLKDMVVKLTQSLLVKDEEIQMLRKLTTDKDLVATTESVRIEA